MMSGMAAARYFFWPNDLSIFLVFICQLFGFIIFIEWNFNIAKSMNDSFCLVYIVAFNVSIMSGNVYVFCPFFTSLRVGRSQSSPPGVPSVSKTSLIACVSVKKGWE